MRKDGYYSSGQFAKLAGVTVRTIRFYDKQNILKPSLVTEKGARFYTQEDLGRLQQILLLKYLGLSLDDIKELTIADEDYHILRNQLELQRTLVQDKIEQLQLVQKAIESTVATIDSNQHVDWMKMQELIHLTSMENTLKAQYQNSNNINARIRLHNLYATNQEGWFPWLYNQCEMKSGMRVLEIGCGNGSLWIENMDRLPENMEIHLTDASQGMIRDVRRTIQALRMEKGMKGEGVGATNQALENRRTLTFKYQVLTAEKLATLHQTYDLILANHVLFYVNDLEDTIEQIKAHLNPGGRLICSTYGKNHMKEIRELAHEFDERISLSGDVLYEKFGLQNGKEILEKYFSRVEQRNYEDHLEVTEPEPLLEYILSCHGNQNQYLLDRYKDFRNFLTKKTKKPYIITKEAGIFISQ